MNDQTLSRFHNQSLGSLQLQLSSLKQLVTANKAEQAEIMAEVVNRLGGTLRNDLAAKGKGYGSHTRELPDGVKVKGEIKQTVKWDGDQLRTIASTLTWEQIAHYFKITFVVPEGIYKALDPTSKIYGAITNARTTSLGDLTVSFVAPKD